MRTRTGRLVLSVLGITVAGACGGRSDLDGYPWEATRGAAGSGGATGTSGRGSVARAGTTSGGRGSGGAGVPSGGRTVGGGAGTSGAGVSRGGSGAAGSAGASGGLGATAGLGFGGSPASGAAGRAGAAGAGLAGRSDAGGDGGSGGMSMVNESVRCEAMLSPPLEAILPTSAGLKDPIAGIAADFDGDGRLDLALMNGDDLVAAFHGSGDGSLHLTTVNALGLSPAPMSGSFDFPTASLAVGDVNGDGRLDVVGVSSNAQGVGMLLGSPSGNLFPGLACTVNGSPGGVATGDFDGDGRDEIAVSVAAETTTLRVLRGDGSCTTLWQSADVDYYGPLGAADVNGDGRLDLLLSGAGLDVFLGDGNGAFVAGNHYDGPLEAAAVLLDDFDHDGSLDVAVTMACTRHDTSSVLVRAGHGDGTFGAATEYVTGICAEPGGALDVTGDGNSDLVLAPELALPGNGDGSFGAFIHGPEALGGTLVGVGDFDGDAQPDVAVASSDDVVVRHGNGDGTFGAAPLFATDATPGPLALVDLNGDAKLDLVTANSGTSYPNPESVSVLFGDGSGSFAPHVDYPVARVPSALAASDVNGDGRPDLLVASGDSDVLSVLLQTSDGNFASATELELATLPELLTLGDVNGDGKQDAIIVKNDTLLEVLLGAGDRSFVAEPDFTLPAVPSALVPLDANGDGRLDLALSFAGYDSVRLYLGRGDGTFANGAALDVSGAQGLAAGDLNRDGHVDLVATGGLSLSVLLGDGSGTFAPRVDYAPGGVNVTLSDLDGDGALDVVASLQGIVVFKGRGDGTLECFQNYAIGGPTGALAAGDLNGDGRSDVAVVTTNGVSVLLNAEH